MASRLDDPSAIEFPFQGRAMDQRFVEHPDWASTTESRKAWMSVRDADLLEQVLLRMAVLKQGEPLRVLEWGGGRSTAWYTKLLEWFHIPHLWLSLETNRSYFDADIRPLLSDLRKAEIHYAEEIDPRFGERLKTGSGLVCVVYDYGTVMPFESGLMSDRLVNMDPYVALPQELGYACDLAIVDGRKRRRCVIEARGLIGQSGAVLLHDAWRSHYSSAFDMFAQSRRFGDEWCIGTGPCVNLLQLLPADALRNHVPDPVAP